MKTSQLKFNEITEKIIKCCFKVYNTLGFGYLESVYEKCLMIEFTKEGIKYEFQKPINVIYEGHSVGQFFADFLIDDIIIVELKSIRQLSKIHEMQVVNYLTATGIDVGLLINFGDERVELKRKVRTLSMLRS